VKRVFKHSRILPEYEKLLSPVPPSWQWSRPSRTFFCERRKVSSTIFQQDGVTCHTSKISMWKYCSVYLVYVSFLVSLVLVFQLDTSLTRPIHEWFLSLGLSEVSRVYFQAAYSGPTTGEYSTGNSSHYKRTWKRVYVTVNVDSQLMLIISQLSSTILVSNLVSYEAIKPKFWGPLVLTNLHHITKFQPDWWRRTPWREWKLSRNRSLDSFHSLQYVLLNQSSWDMWCRLVRTRGPQNFGFINS